MNSLSQQNDQNQSINSSETASLQEGNLQCLKQKQKQNARQSTKQQFNTKNNVIKGQVSKQQSNLKLNANQCKQDKFKNQVSQFHKTNQQNQKNQNYQKVYQKGQFKKQKQKLTEMEKIVGNSNLDSQQQTKGNYQMNYPEEKTKPKNRIKRFNLQNVSQPQKPKAREPVVNYKIKHKTGTGQIPSKLQYLTLCTWNVNGIRFSVSKNHLPYYINQTKPDILCLTQTKMDQYSFTKQPIDIFGFNGYWNFCKCSSGYSGVVVFSKFQPIRVIQGIRENFEGNEQDDSQYGEDFDKQGRVLTLEFKEFFLVTAYVPAAGKQLQRLQYKCKQWEPRFFAFCQKLMKLKPTIVSGDLNTALTELDTHMTKNTTRGPAFTITERQSLQGFINKNNLIDTYRFKNPTKKQFTWWHIKYFGRQLAIGKRLDYFLVPQQFKTAIMSSQIKQKYKGSDHSPFEIRLNLNKM